MSFDWYGGIDFSGAKEPLSTVWSTLAHPDTDGKLRVVALRPHAFRADLCGHAAEGWREAGGAGPGERVLWGADVPFGLPATAATLICGADCTWEQVAAWVADRPADEVLAAAPDDVRQPRATDRRSGTPDPLGVRSYRQTVEGIRWLWELRERCGASLIPVAPNPAAAVNVIETSPATTARDLGLRARRVPGRAGQVRARAAALAPWIRFAEPSLEAVAVNLEDAWDSVLSCLTAYLSAGDLDQPARMTAAEPVALEGWTFRSPAALAADSAPHRT